MSLKQLNWSYCDWGKETRNPVHCGTYTYKETVLYVTIWIHTAAGERTSMRMCSGTLLYTKILLCLLSKHIASNHAIHDRTF